MITNYLKIAFRNLKRNFAFSLINILGLTLGLAITSLVTLYVNHELSYDNYHKDAPNIYRLFKVIEVDGYYIAGRGIKSPMGPYLVKTYPKVISQTRLEKTEREIILTKDRSLFEEKVLYVDPGFFEIFTHESVYGNLKEALNNPYSLVLTKTIAEKLFGNTNPIGEFVTDDKEYTYKITAVIEDVPENSVVKFGILCPLNSLKGTHNQTNINNWFSREVKEYATYIKLADGYKPEELEAEFPNIIKTHHEKKEGVNIDITLQPIRDIYLYYYGGGNLDRIYLFSVIGMFVLLIACINYMNLNTANSMRRFKEIGVRKVLGADKKQLVKQILLESIIISLISLLFALTLAEILLPSFNNLLEKELCFEYIHNWELSLTFIGLAIFTGLLAGSYPAFYLSSFKPILALKGKFMFKSNHALFRDALVILQFAITIFLLCCTGIILKQIKYANNADLGFDKDNIILLNLHLKNNDAYRDDEARKIAINHQLEFLKTEVDKIPEILKYSQANLFPFGGLNFDRIKTDDNEKGRLAALYDIDENYTKLLNLKILKGRNFSKENSLEKDKVIINETLAKQMGWKNPIGKSFSTSNDKSIKYTVIGMLKDYNIRSFHDRIYPILMRYIEKADYYGNIGMKVNPKNTQTIIRKIENLQKKINVNWELSYSFLDKQVEKRYLKEYRTGKMFSNFTLLAIIIATLGLYGLTLFQSRLRTKEIGVRKVFGSSKIDIISLLARKLFKLILISAMIGIPAAYLYMDKWLQQFVFQVGNRWTVYVFAVILALGIAFITILYQAIKASKANPVDALRYE